MSLDLPYQEILREALKEGGEFADLFFEQTFSMVIICEEDRIEKAISVWTWGWTSNSLRPKDILWFYHRDLKRFLLTLADGSVGLQKKVGTR